MNGYVNMAKRKANIFIVAESVTNWFEANSHAIPDTENIEAGITRSKPGSPTMCTPPETEIVGHGFEVGQPVPVPSQVAVEPANWVRDNQQATELAEASSPRGTSKATETRSTATNEVTGQDHATHEAFWALLTAAGYEEW